MSKFNTCLRNGFVSFGDDLDSVAEVTHLFGCKATKLPYHNWFCVPGREDTIGSLLSENGGDGWTNTRKLGLNCDEHGWNEILEISEFNKNSEKTKERIEEELARPRMRYVFWREEREGARWYKFYGTFRIDADATRASQATEQPRAVYARVEKTAPCLKVEEKEQVFTDDEFMGLKGRIVRVNFLDEIAFSADCGKTIEGEVTAWPGTKLLVTDVTSGSVHVTCSTKDENLLAAARQRIPVKARENFSKIVGFSIPRRDFALGYVEVLPGVGSLEDTFEALSVA